MVNDMRLPQEFEARMQDMLGEAYPAFRQSYEKNKFQALRVNPMKGTQEAFLQSAPFIMRKVPWAENGFYYSEQDQPGKHPWHEAGVYYIQEPSAMAPAAYLEAKPGEKVLDLCAAPGGKTTQIAASMQGQGILVCNEIHPARARILAENVERMGIPHALVTNETAAKLADIFDEYFDRILVDAPCSGEGMFRKNEEACDEWSLDNVRLCAQRQDEILDHAASMLRAGGRLVYSTCTFAPAENEGSMARFLMRHPDFTLEEVPLYEGMSRGVSQWAFYGEDSDVDVSGMHLERTIRLWPHKLDGEGHFLAVLRKAGEVPQGYTGFLKYGTETGFFPANAVESRKAKKGKQQLSKAADYSQFFDFQKDTLQIDLMERENGGLYLFGEQLYLLPKDMPSLHTLKVLRCGLHLGTLKKNRFEPSHALALALKPQEVQHVWKLSATDTQTVGYLNGQTLTCDDANLQKGWYLITVDGYSLGWGKLAGQIMKNHYPKGLRKP